MTDLTENASYSDATIEIAAACGIGFGSIRDDLQLERDRREDKSVDATELYDESPSSKNEVVETSNGRKNGRDRGSK